MKQIFQLDPYKAGRFIYENFDNIYMIDLSHKEVYNSIHYQKAMNVSFYNIKKMCYNIPSNKKVIIYHHEGSYVDFASILLRQLRPDLDIYYINGAPLYEFNCIDIHKNTNYRLNYN